MAIIYINLFCIFQVLYHALAKVATNNDIDVIDLCFIRTFINFLIACGTVTYSGQHLIHGVPKEMRHVLFIRCMIGVVGFTCLVYGLKLVPIFISSIILQTMPFWTSIMGYFLNKEVVTKSEVICMVGCFAGVLVIAFSKYEAEKQQLAK